jgi:hypothetical protein
MHLDGHMPFNRRLDGAQTVSSLILEFSSDKPKSDLVSFVFSANRQGHVLSCR